MPRRARAGSAPHAARPSTSHPIPTRTPRARRPQALPANGVLRVVLHHFNLEQQAELDALAFAASDEEHERVLTQRRFDIVLVLRDTGE